MDKNEKIKAYVTRYALSRGILEVEGNVHPDSTLKMFYYGEYAAVFGEDWHRTKEDAVARAENMRKKKILSLQKQIKKLENMTFEIKDEE